MSLSVSGRVSRIIDRDVNNVSNPFVERTYVIEDWGQTLYAVRARNFEGGEPSEGDTVTLGVSVRAYVNKDGKAGYGLTAHRSLVGQTDAADSGKRSAASV